MAEKEDLSAPAAVTLSPEVDNAAKHLPELDRKIIASMDGWVEKKKRKKTGRNRGPDEVLDVDEMLDEIDAEDPPDYDEIERLRRLEQEYGDLSRFTPSEVEDLMMGCSTSEPGDQEPKSFEPGDQEPKSFEPGDREPKSFEPGDHEPKSSEPGDREPPVDPTVAQKKYEEAHLKIFGSDAIELDDSSSETDVATMAALVEQRNFVHPDAVAPAKEEPGLGTSKDKKAKQDLVGLQYLARSWSLARRGLLETNLIEEEHR
ncbi:hypothetical protein AK812_SmicGene32728 [Symbiodinium microadriaticum]|uniref:Uncharacterized protein n=1 Tax=Symbiodinium microadriaticum TaxID=2951 RepID=A0A1Q9CTI9_SYMMI|nr:hypothetical protein AK812_SmicGene32728 [Symbiodinium microadriaticum]